MPKEFENSVTKSSTLKKKDVRFDKDQNNNKINEDEMVDIKSIF